MIEDDSYFALLLAQYLKRYNIEITNYEDPYLGLSVDLNQYVLLLLDLTLPGMDGLDVCKEVLQKYQLPIIISSARSDTEDKIKGLRLGVDDYLPKPYDPEEMYLRIISVLKRYNNINKQDSEDKIFLDEKKESIILNKEKLNLTPAEYSILRLLILNLGVTVSKGDILYDKNGSVLGSDGSLSVILNRLRKKLKGNASIKTIRGIGYKLII